MVSFGSRQPVLLPVAAYPFTLYAMMIGLGSKTLSKF
jgi:hypothetical protein